MQLRDYQERAVAEVLTDIDTPTCLCAPTGSGKTVMGSTIVARAGLRTVWVTHRDELIDQSAAALESVGCRVGVFASGRMESLDAPVIVASWQTMLARPDDCPEAELCAIDECHHASADEWVKPVMRYPRRIGFTATPQRGDGRPLDMFKRLVVAAQYSELLKAGHLVPCKLFRPDEDISPNLARGPLEAYQAHAQGQSCIVFARSVELAREYAAEFTEAGFPAAALDAKTPAAERADLIARFKAGELTVLCNVFVLTEGFDAPATECCIIARGCSYTGTYLQMVGRVLRPAPGKTHATLIDLAGVSHSHGLPTEDRSYSLDGKQAISSTGALRVCPSCGLCYAPTGEAGCPGCGFVSAERGGPPAPRIYDMELAEVFCGADTPGEYKRREWDRLLMLCARRGWAIDWAAREYRKLFDTAPDPSWFTDQMKLDALMKWRALGAAKGYKPGFAAVRYKSMFGVWPPRGL